MHSHDLKKTRMMSDDVSGAVGDKLEAVLGEEGHVVLHGEVV